MRLAAAIGLGALIVGAQAFGAAFPSPPLYPSFNQSKPAGTITTFRVSHSDYTAPASINSKGAITGTYRDAHSVYHGFVREADGKYSVFSAPDATTSELEGTLPASINDNGAVAGSYYDESHKVRGFVRGASGKITTFDIPGEPNSNPPQMGLGVYAINNSGAVLGGYRASNGDVFGFLWVNGTLKKFYAGSRHMTSPQNMNATGAIVGFYYDKNTNSPGFILNADGSLAKFHIGLIQTTPMSINSAGAVTGYYTDHENNYGFLRAADGTITKLNVQGATQTSPCCINNSGTIAGSYRTNKSGGGFLRAANGTITTIRNVPVAMNAKDVITGLYFSKSGDVLGFVRAP